MTATIAQAKPKTFRLRVANRNTITLPAELREQLGLKPGDGVEITLSGDHTQRATSALGEGAASGARGSSAGR